MRDFHNIISTHKEITREFSNVHDWTLKIPIMATNKNLNLSIPSHSLTNIKHFRGNKHLWTKIQRLKTTEELKFPNYSHFPTLAAHAAIFSIYRSHTLFQN